MAKAARKQSASLKLAIEAASKRYGTGAVMDMTNTVIPKIPRVSYGSIEVDLASGGGAPKGRIIEIYGPESSGKTTLMLHLIREAQNDPQYVAEGRRPLFVDAEHALDLKYAKNGIGVDTEDMLISQPYCAEDALQIVEDFISTGEISVCVVDSVAGLVPRAELEGEMGDAHVGLQSRLMSQALRKLVATVQRTGTILVFINQIRMKIGVMFGNPETQTGGNALKFYASHRIDIRSKKSSDVDSEGNLKASDATVKFVKNKTFPPFREALVSVVYGRGVGIEGEVLDHGVKLGLLELSGHTYSFTDTREKAFKEAYAAANPQTYEELETLVAQHPIVDQTSLEKRRTVNASYQDLRYLGNSWKIVGRPAAIKKLQEEKEFTDRLYHSIRSTYFPEQYGLEVEDNAD